MAGFTPMMAWGLGLVSTLILESTLLANSRHEDALRSTVSTLVESKNLEQGEVDTDADALPAPAFHSGLKLTLKEGDEPLPQGLSYSLNAPANLPKSNVDQTSEALTPGLYEIAVQQNGQEVFRKQIIALEGQTSDLELSYKKAEGFSLRQTLELPQIKFVSGQKKIAKPSFSDLKKLVKILQADDAIELFGFEAHTDSNGDADKNQELTDERAVVVRNYLVKNGVDAQRVKAKGFGATRPIATNDTTEGRLANRRVEFVILETSAKPKLLGDR